VNIEKLKLNIGANVKVREDLVSRRNKQRLHTAPIPCDQGGGLACSNDFRFWSVVFAGVSQRCGSEMNYFRGWSSKYFFKNKN
jgi:hypothetical protein